MSTIVNGASARRLAAPLCAAFVSTMLAACGGDGGEAPPPPPPPPPANTATLSVDAGATSTASSGATIPLHAVLTNSTATPTWTLTGPGSLSASTGGDITYTPPDAEDFAQAATAQVTVKAGDLTSNVSIAVAVGGKPGLHWTTVHPFTPPWTSVGYANGNFVAVGRQGAMGVSADGLHWTWHFTSADLSWAALVHAPSGWVALSNDGYIAKSPDGAQWTISTSRLPGADATTWVSSMAYGDGRYVVGGYSGSWTSTDAVTWTNASDVMNSLSFGAGEFIGLGAASELVAGTDGFNWTQTFFNSGAETTAYANGQFAARLGSYMITSVDGQTWTTPVATGYSDSPLLSTGAEFLQYAGTNTIFQDGQQFDVNYLATSTDGLTWAHHDEALIGPAAGAARGPSQVVVVSNDGSIGSGPDFDHLQQAVASSGSFLSAVDYVHGKYFVLSDGGQLMSSTDGQAWSQVSLAAVAAMRQPYGFHGLALAHDASGRMVALGLTMDNGAAFYEAFYSADGSTWHQTTTPSTMTTSIVVNDGSRFLALSDHEVYASADGSAWALASAIPLQSGQWVNGAAYGNGRYVVVGQGGLVASSADAVNWSVAGTLHLPGDASTALDLWRVVFTGSRFVAVGIQGVVATSADGVTWSAAPSATGSDLRGIAVSPQGELVAVGLLGVAETSMDGVHWTVRSTPNTAPMWGVVYGNNAFLSVGEDGYMGLSSN